MSKGFGYEGLCRQANNGVEVFSIQNIEVGDQERELELEMVHEKGISLRC